MANKSLLYGLGSGLIIGAVLLQLMNAAAPKNMELSKTEMPPSSLESANKDQLKTAASKYFQVFEKDEAVLTKAQSDALVQQRFKEEQGKASSAEASPAQTQKEIVIYVKSGLGVIEVSDMLYQSGIITDKKAFEDEMEARQLTGKLAVGVHIFKGPQTLEQIIANLMKQ